MKKVAAALAVAAIFVVIGVLLLLPALVKNDFTASMGVTWYDKDGKPITGPFAFVNPNGQVVTAVEPKVTWTLKSSRADATMTSVIVGGNVTVTVYLNTPTAGVVGTKGFAIFASGASALSGSQSAKFILSDLIGTPTQAGKDYGWIIEFVGKLNAGAIVDGDQVQANWSGKVSYKITWGTAGLTLEGQILA